MVDTQKDIVALELDTWTISGNHISSHGLNSVRLKIGKPVVFTLQPCEAQGRVGMNIWAEHVNGYVC